MRERLLFLVLPEPRHSLALSTRSQLMAGEAPQMPFGKKGEDACASSPVPPLKQQGIFVETRVLPSSPTHLTLAPTQLSSPGDPHVRLPGRSNHPGFRPGKCQPTPPTCSPHLGKACPQEALLPFSDATREVTWQAGSLPATRAEVARGGSAGREGHPLTLLPRDGSGELQIILLYCFPLLSTSPRRKLPRIY